MKTNSVLGSNDEMAVNFIDVKGETAGGIWIRFEDLPMYSQNYCKLIWEPIPTTLPDNTDKIWRITVTKYSDIRIRINCNGVEVLNSLLSTDCEDERWATIWARDITKIEFHTYDDAPKFAPDFYRPYPGTI